MKIKKNKNAELLEKLARDRFDYALVCDPGSEEAKKAFDEGMKAQQMANEIKKSNFFTEEKAFTLAMAVFTGIVTPLFINSQQNRFRREMTTIFLNWENDGNTLTSYPGKTFCGGLFR